MAQISDIIERALNDCKDEIIRRHQSEGQIASGNTMHSLKVIRLSDTHFQLIQQGDSFAPLGTLDEGRAPGKVPFNFWQIIARWAEAKGITFTDTKEANRFARSVAWFIYKKGTKRFRKNVDVVSTPIEECKKKIIEDVSFFYKADIKQKLFRKDFKL